MNKMNAVLNVREIETMSSCSWNTEKSIGMSADNPHRASMMYDGHPSSRSPNSQHGSQQGFSTKYPIKTLCFAKKSSSYTLWNIKKDKTFEKLPAKVNTPNRIRAYLGNQFSGCLLIMPSEEIQLVSDVMEKTDLRPPALKENTNKAPHHLTDQETTIYSGTALSSLQISQDPVSLKRNHTGTGTGIDVNEPHLNKVRPFLTDLDYGNNPDGITVTYQANVLSFEILFYTYQNLLSIVLNSL